MKNDNHTAPLRFARLALATLSMVVAGSAMAQFIDERTPPAPKAAATTPAAQVSPVPAGAAAPREGASFALPEVTVPAVSAAPAAPAAPLPAFEVTSRDHTVREVVARWSKSQGWTHELNHWAVDRDLPVMGTAGADVFGDDFKGAVRKLLASSELTDRPVQPCFYSNHVIRVIPKTEFCDRTVE